MEPSASASDTSLTAVLDTFANAGYPTTFTGLDDGMARCGSCGSEVPVSELQVGARHRLEGMSDPDDMMLVVGAACPVCARTGTLVVSYGPMSEPRDTQIVANLVIDPATPDPLGSPT